MCWFRTTLEYLIKKLPLPTKRATIILIEVKSYSAFSCMLLLCILINLKSVLRYNFFILDTCNPDDLYLCEQGLRTEVFFFRSQEDSAKKMSGLRCSRPLLLSRFRCIFWHAILSFKYGKIFRYCLYFLFTKAGLSLSYNSNIHFSFLSFSLAEM